MSSSRKSWLVALAGLTVTGLAAYLFNARKSIFRKRRVLTREELIEILSELADSFHSELVEASQCVQRADMIAAQKPHVRDPREGLEEEMLHSILLDGGIGSSLQARQSAIFDKFNVIQEEVTTATDLYIEDPVVERLKEGLDEMLSTYLEGGMPVNPNVSVTFSEKDLLATLKEIMREKEKQIGAYLNEQAHLMDGSPDSGIAIKLSEIARNVESEITSKRGITEAQLRSALAAATNSSRTFRKKLMGLLFEFQSVPKTFETKVDS